MAKTQAAKVAQKPTAKSILGKLLILPALMATTATALSPFQQASASLHILDNHNLSQIQSSAVNQVRASPGEWLKLKDQGEFSPAKRYGHSATIYEPPTTAILEKLRGNLRLADINQRQAQQQEGASQTVEDTSYMIVFGGKNAEIDVLFNDIYFLGIPSFDWYIPHLAVLNQNEAPSERLGHTSAIYGDTLYVFGGHTIANPMNGNQEISNELFALNLQTMTWSKQAVNAANQVMPLAYTASTVMLDDGKMAIFGGLTQDKMDGQFKVVNEVLFLDMKTATWEKPGRVFVNSMEDMPKARMGATLVNYGDKLWVYAGADPYGSGDVYSDFFSFDTKTGLWKKESEFTELKQGEGMLLGSAVRMYNSNAVMFSGGCNIATQQCSFDTSKSILFNQPNAHFSDKVADSEDFSGRMGHTLVQLGESVISFGGCSFNKVCMNELLIQKPMITEANNLYDCKNGKAVQMDKQGLALRYCTCTDESTGTDNEWFTGPQCLYKTTVIDQTVAAQQPVAALQQEPTQEEEQVKHQAEAWQDASFALSQSNMLPEPMMSAQVGKEKANDGSCDGNCSGNGICFTKSCYCDIYHGGDNCEMDLAHPGVKAPVTFMFYGVALFLGLVTGSFVAKIYNDNNKKLFL